jgi:type II secretory pathway component PulM
MKRSVLIGVIAGGVVLVLLWYFVLFSPTSSKLDSTRADVASAQSQKQQLENTIQQLKELSRNAAQQQAKLAALRAAVPPTPDLGAFILQANDIATASGIDWLSITPSPPAASGTGGPTSTIRVAMQVQGGFYQVLDYLNRLENMQRLVIVDTINVSAGGAGGGTTGGSGSTSSAGSSSGSTDATGAPDLSVTLTGRMFTGAQPAVSSGAAGAGASGATTPTTPATTPGSSTPTTPPASSSGSSS